MQQPTERCRCTAKAAMRDDQSPYGRGQTSFVRDEQRFNGSRLADGGQGVSTYQGGVAIHCSGGRGVADDTSTTPTSNFFHSDSRPSLTLWPVLAVVSQSTPIQASTPRYAAD